MKTLYLLFTGALCLQASLAAAQANLVVTGPASATPGTLNTIVRSNFAPTDIDGKTLTGSENIYLGYNAGNAYYLSSSRNTLLGTNTGTYTNRRSTVVTTDNTLVGAGSGNYLLGNFNTFLGSGTGGIQPVNQGSSVNTGNYNTFSGYQAGFTNKGGSTNSFIGSFSGYANSDGKSNVAVGNRAMSENQLGSYNVVIGDSAGLRNNANRNTYVGNRAGLANQTGENNVFIGWQANSSGGNEASLSNSVALGANARVAVSNAIVLGDPTNANLKVGIGTDSPQFPLDVRGTVNIRGAGGKIKFTHLLNPRWHSEGTDQLLTVNDKGEVVLTRYRLIIDKPDEWADKVFEKGYSLRSLSDVERFVNQHKHLPGVPSAEKVINEGISLEQLTVRLLEKVEELTLYNIQLEKTTKSQQAQIDELKRLVDSLPKTK